MRKSMVGFFMILVSGLLLAGGCAKKEIVKSEEPSAAAARPAETAAAKPDATTIPAQKVKEAPVVAEAATGKSVQTVAESALGTIYFDFDSPVLSQASRDTLKKNADYLLKQNTAVKVQVEGHCDERGSDEYNIALGEKRAKAALNYLETLGVPAARLSFISYGKERPADPGHDEAAWAKNRRDEFVVIK